MISHPNIARIFDYSEGGATDGTRRPYLVMELVDGPSLADLLTGGPVGTAYTLDVLAQVGAGLAAAHAVDLVHRDIKPPNLLISGDGLVKITDFGIAQAEGAAHMTRTGVLVGTGAYLAPERAAGTQAGPAADLYSLGVVAFVCLTGRRPFSGDPLSVIMAHQTQPLPPLPPEIPEPVMALVGELTAKDPGARPAGAAEVAARAERLRAEIGDIGPARPDLPPLAPAVVSTGTQPVPWGGVAVALPPGDGDLWGTTGSAAGLPPVAYASEAGESGDFPPDEQDMRPGRGSRRMGVGLATAAVVVLAGLGVWAFGGLSGQAEPVRMTGGTHPAARRTTKPARHTVSTPPVPAATSAVGSAPAAPPPTRPVSSRSVPATRPTSTHRRTLPSTPAPTRSATPPPTPTPTPTPTGTATPTPTPTGSG